MPQQSFRSAAPASAVPPTEPLTGAGVEPPVGSVVEPRAEVLAGGRVEPPTGPLVEPADPTSPLPEHPVGARPPADPGADDFDIRPELVVERLPYADGSWPEAEFLRLRLQRGEDGRLRHLGRPGTTARVCAATTATGRPVAVKYFTAERDDLSPEESEAHAERVAKEWRAASLDFGPGVVRAHAAYRLGDDGPFPGSGWVLVMNLVAGPSLDEVMQRVHDVGAIDPETQLRWLLDGLRSLRELEAGRHQLRDISPRNIALSSSDLATALPVFLDHGTARRDGTVTGEYLGTFDYAAPEYLVAARKRRPGASWDGSRVDLYSFGAVLLDVFTGGQGFDDHEREANTLRSLSGRPLLEQEAIDPRVAGILRGALVKDPELRPSVAELLHHAEHPELALPRWDAAAPWPEQLASPPVIATIPLDGAEELLDGTTPLPPLPGRPGPVRVTDDDADAAASPPTAAGAAAALAPQPVRLLPLWDPVLEQLRAPAPSVRTGSFLERFAGIDPRFATAASDRTVYRILGMLLLVYAAYAIAATMGLVVMATGEAGVWQLVLGGLLGLSVAVVMIGLDRSIMATSSARLDRLDDPGVDAAPLKRGFSPSIAVRILFAVLFALVVGEAANLMVFDRDIQAQLQSQQDQAVEAKKAEIEADYQQLIDVADATVAAAQTAKTDYDLELTELAASIEAERLGTGFTGAAGCGPQCELLIAEYNDKLAAKSAFHESKDEEIRVASADKVAYETAKLDAANAARELVAADNGIFAREEALRTLLFDDRWKLAKYLVITACLFFLELAAVIIKLATRGNSYEHNLARALRHEAREASLLGQMHADLARRRAHRNTQLLAAADDRYFDTRLGAADGGSEPGR